jgi:hypothetical protein
MFFGKGANFTGLLLNLIDLQAIGWKYYIVYVGWLCVEVVGIYFLFFFFLETKCWSLEGIVAGINRKSFVVREESDAFS